jgi:hypothetical protein
MELLRLGGRKLKRMRVKKDSLEIYSKIIDAVKLRITPGGGG